MSNNQNVLPFTIGEKNVPEIGDKIFSFLDRKSLLVARVVCKEWNSCVDGRTGLWTNISSERYQVLAQALFIHFFLLVKKLCFSLKFAGQNIKMTFLRARFPP